MSNDEYTDVTERYDIFGIRECTRCGKTGDDEERAEIPYELADTVRRTVESQRKLITDGGTVENGTVRGQPGATVGAEWARLARKNEEEWGVQHPEELLSAISEEVGEIEQAYLEATHEDASQRRVREEIDDLGPLLLQLIRSIAAHPGAFEALPTLRRRIEMSEDGTERPE